MDIYSDSEDDKIDFIPIGFLDDDATKQKQEIYGVPIIGTLADLPRVLNGLGIAIVSTNKGVLSDRQCREQKVGGEFLCTVS